MNQGKTDSSFQLASEMASTQYRIDASISRLTVQAFATGLLSFLGHNPTFIAREFGGMLRWELAAEQSDLEIVISASSWELADNVRAADCEEIERKMRNEVLETGAFPEIRFQTKQICTEQVAEFIYRLRLDGELRLHGVSNHQVMEADLRYYDDGVRLAGGFPLRISDYRIRPVSALAGAILLRDQLRLSFDLAAWKEAA